MSTSNPNEGLNDNRGPELLAILWTFTIASLVIVIFKIYTRFRIIHQTGLDDILIFFSTILVLICTILFTVDVRYGMGRHAYTLSLDNAIKAVKINYIANPFGIMAYSIPNIAVGIFIDRILPLRRWKRIGLYTLVISQTIIAGVSCVLLFTQCMPTKSLWDPRVMPTSCLSFKLLTRYSYFVGSYTAFTDVVLAIVPIWTFRKLQMPRKAKVATSIIMSMTLAAAVCAIVKTWKLDQLADLHDFTYGTVDLIITAVVEANVIIIAACIPSLRPFVIAVGQSMSQSTTLRRLKSSSFSSKKTSKSDSTSWFKLSSMGNDPESISSQFDEKHPSGHDESSDRDLTGITKTTDFSVMPAQSRTGSIAVKDLYN